MSGCEKHGGIHMRPWKEKEKYFFIRVIKTISKKETPLAVTAGGVMMIDCINKNTPFCMKNIEY